MFYSYGKARKMSQASEFLTSFCFLNLEKVNILALYSNLQKQTNDGRDLGLNIKEC